MSGRDRADLTVSFDIYAELNAIKAELMRKLRKRLTWDDVIAELIKAYRGEK